ncbi:MAG: NADP oxidoreductase [Anaerolineae bacterium]
MSKVKFATVWLDGCSGCHMSFLDIDERLIALAEVIELVYSPLVDNKEFPADVDVTMVEGSVSSEEDLHKIKYIRERTKVLISLGDCAVTGNVPSLRNSVGKEAVLQRAYMESDLLNPQIPSQVVPKLLSIVRPVHSVVKVDVYIPGCPPSADTIFNVLNDLLAGKTPNAMQYTRFGA